MLLLAISATPNLGNLIPNSVNAENYPGGKEINFHGGLERSYENKINSNIYDQESQKNGYYTTQYSEGTDVQYINPETGSDGAGNDGDDKPESVVYQEKPQNIYSTDGDISSTSYRSNHYSNYDHNSNSPTSYNGYLSASYSSNDYQNSKPKFAEIEKNDNSIFICDNGIVVDDRINCPQKCPFNTPLEGVYVMDLDVCNIQPGLGVTCPLDTDLPGVVVLNEANCNIFEICDAASTPLGAALGQQVKVADSALCQLSNIPNLQVCPPGSLFEGFAVNDLDSCDLLEGVQICGPTTDLAGVLTTDTATCNLFEECTPPDPIFNALPAGSSAFPVVDEEICQITVPEGVDLFTCAAGTENEFAVVTDLQLCDAPGDQNICGPTTDLPGVYVENINTQCNIFETCVTGDPIFGLIADTPGGDSPFDVVDAQICQIGSAGGGDGNELFTCPSNSNMAGAVVTDPNLCQAPDDGNKCPAGTDLEGVYVMNTQTDCELPDPADEIVCPSGTALEGIEVSDLQFCNLHGLDKCSEGSDLEGVFVMDTDGNTVFDDNLPDTTEPICNQGGGGQGQICPMGTDLEGVVVENAPDDCEIDLDDVELQLCPAGTALAGVSVDINSPDTTPMDNIPDICTVQGLEKCPDMTDQAGHFVMGDGDLSTTDELLPLCDLEDPEICALDTDLAGMVVADTDEINDGQEAACEISIDDVELQLCPAGTALAGVSVDINSPDTTPMDNIPDICTVQGLEKCPDGTVQEGHFVMGDGNIMTTVPEDTMLAEICNASDDEAEVCPIDTQLAGVLVDNTVDLDTACNPFEICPANTVLEGVAVLDDGDPDTPLPAELCTLNGLEKCPAGTDEAGHFVMGDGNPLTTSELAFVCDSIDIAIANDNSDNVHIRLGTGTGTFGASTAFTMGDAPQSVALADLNLDGFLDLVTANFNSDNFSVRLGDGTGGFGAQTNIGLGGADGPRSVAVGFFNNDAIPDLAFAMYNDDAVEIRLGTGTGITFTAAADVPVGQNPRSIALGFFNNDAFIDMAIANEGDDDVSIRLGTGLGTFTAAADVPVQDQPFSVAVGLFNNDPFLDLAVANSNSDSVSIRLGVGDGTFTGVTNIAVGDEPRSVAVGNFNPLTDNFQDIVTANFGNANTVTIRLGNGDGTFTGTATVTVGTDPTFVAVADFNRDGYDDIAVANFGANTFSTLINSGANTYARTDLGTANNPIAIAVGFIN